MAEPQEHAANVPPADTEPAPRRSPVWSLDKPVRSMHLEFRTDVAVAGVTVTGELPGTARPPLGSIAISGDVHRLSCDQAVELADALLLVVMRMDVVAEKHYGATTDAPRDRED